MRLVRHETAPPQEAELTPDEVVVRFRTGGICGSDIPRCRDVGTGPDPEPFGSSLHEIVGEIVASRSDLDVGQRVVGWATNSRGLSEYVRTSADELLAIELDLDDVHAVALQPLACVLHALSRLPSITGARTAVIGLGPIGLLFGHALKDAGAESVVGVDPIDRSDIAATYGLDRVECLSSRSWSRRPDAADGFDLVIEAVGHQVGTLEDAIAVAAPDATVVYFGNPDDDYYPIRLGAMMDKRLTLQAGRTPIVGRRSALRRAVDYLARYPDLFASYVTDVLPVDQASQAYEIASRPAPSRLKVVIDGVTSPTRS
ncbi:MAG TPA: zinc-binding dehydrogenase [Nocardioidaceae bacterium]|nr:zinc-binding dehydrogenase [Nocardioidaceae bacterium]